MLMRRGNGMLMDVQGFRRRVPLIRLSQLRKSAPSHFHPSRMTPAWELIGQDKAIHVRYFP